MAKRKTRIDPTFGELTHCAGDGWRRPLDLRIFNRTTTVSLFVDVSPKGIEKNQILAYQDFRDNSNALMADAERAIFEYYQAICTDYRDRYGIVDCEDELVPIINSVEAVFKLVKAEGVTFPYVRPRSTFGLLCQCTWEEEHSLAVKYENGKLVEVGFQDIEL